MKPAAVHLESAELAAVLETDCPPEIFFRRVFHLYLCAVCRQRLLNAHPVEGRALLRQAWGEEPPLDLAPTKTAESQAAGSPVLEAAAELEQGCTEVLRQQATAPALAEELLRYPPGQRRLLVRNASRFQSLGLAEWLLDDARRLWHGEPNESEERSRLALLTVAVTTIDSSTTRHRATLAARAWAYLANALRIQSRLREAEEALANAESRYEEGLIFDRQDSAELQALKARMLETRGRYAESLAATENAMAIYRDLGNKTELAFLKVSHAYTLGRAGRQEEAIAELRSLLTRITRADVGEAIYLSALQGLAASLVEIDRAAEARELLPEIRGLLPAGRDRLNHVRVDWLEALMLDDEGEHQAAEAKLLEVRRVFLAEGIADDAALVSLDLAVLYLRQGRTAEVRRLAQEMIPLFESRAIHREALAALRLFHEAAARDAATVALAREAAAKLRGTTPAGDRR